jgi:hypothetical protein
MTDTTVGATQASVEAAVANIIKVAIAKAKDVIEVNIDDLPDAVFKEVLIQGCKAVLNRGMSKVTIALLGDEDKVKTEAMAIASKNVEDMYAGKIRFTGGAKQHKVSGKVKTEAMRLARNVVKDEIKRGGGKISHYAASEITEAAKEYLETDAGKTLMDVAKANIEKREQAADAGAKVLSGITSKLKTDPKKVAELEEQLSAIDAEDH